MTCRLYHRIADLYMASGYFDMIAALAVCGGPHNVSGSARNPDRNRPQCKRRYWPGLLYGRDFGLANSAGRKYNDS